MYVPAECFLILTVWLLLRFSRCPSWRGAALVAIGALLTLWTLYVTALAIGLAVLAVGVDLWRRRQFRPLARLALALGLAALVYLPWLIEMAHGRPARQPTITLSLLAFAQLWAATTATGVSVNAARWALAGLPWLLLMAIGCARLGGRWARPAIPAVAIGFPALLYLLSLHPTPLYPGRIEARYLLPCLPFTVLLTARGLTWLLQKRWAIGAVAGLAVAAGLGAGLATTLGMRTYSDDVRALGAFVQVYADPTDAVILNPDQDWPIYAYYLGMVKQPAGLPYAAQMNDQRAATWMQRLVGTAQTVWLIQTRDAGQTDPTNAVRRWLAARYPLVDDIPYGETHLFIYSRQSVAQIFDINAVIPRTLFRPVDQSVVSPLQLIGVRPLPPVWQAGDTMFLDALWRSDAAPKSDQLSAALVDLKTGQTVLRVLPTELRGRGLQEMGDDDETLTEFALPVSTALPDDPLQLRLLIGQPAHTTDDVAIGTYKVQGGGQVDGNFTPAETLNVQLGGVIALEGADTPPPTAKPGEQVDLTLYWRSLAPVPQSYTVFVHLANASERIVTQVDRPPDDGAAPTNTWLPGQQIVDRYQLTIPPNTPPGVYRVLVGMYDQATQQRLPTISGPAARLTANRVLVSSLTVTKATP